MVRAGSAAGAAAPCTCLTRARSLGKLEGTTRAASSSLFACWGKRAAVSAASSTGGVEGMLGSWTSSCQRRSQGCSHSVILLRTTGPGSCGGDTAGCCRELYLTDLWPCLLLVGAAGWAGGQHNLRHPSLLAPCTFSMGCLHEWLWGWLSAPPGTQHGIHGEHFAGFEGPGTQPPKELRARSARGCHHRAMCDRCLAPA